MLLKGILVSFIIVGLVLISYCQDLAGNIEKNKIRKSDIFTGIGIMPMFGHVSINYEFFYSEHPNKTFKRRGLKFGAGVYQYYDDGSLNVILSYMCFTGDKNNHFELGLGVAYLHFLSRSIKYVVPAPCIGYRYQKPDGKFIFRTGIGFPELAYLGIGYAFN